MFANCFEYFSQVIRIISCIVEHHQDYHCESQYSEDVNFDETYVECIRILRKILRKHCG